MIQLGVKARDKVSGYVGVVDHRAKYMHSAARLGLQGQVGADNKPPDPIMADECQCEVLNPTPVCEAVEAPDPIHVFGQEVRDPYSGFRGIVTARAVYLNGCVRVAVQPKLDKKKKGKFLEAVWFNEERLEVVGEKKEAPKEKPDRAGPAVSSQRTDNSFR